MGFAAALTLTSCGVPRPPWVDADPSPTDSPNRLKPPTGPLAGVGAWAGPDVARELDHSGSRWYYTWAPDPTGIKAPKDIEFVPMIQSLADLTPENLTRAAAHGDTLLTFNEPDVSTQANMTVEQMIAAWPQLEATGMRLGSPAVSVFADREGELFHQFMTAIEAHNYRVDFVAAHWYPLPGLGDDYSVDEAVASLRGYLEGVYELYGRPIWLTEFSLVTWYATYSRVQPVEKQAAFLSAAVEMMRTLPYLERWAWFSLQPVRYAVETSMYDDETKATPVGEAFRQAV